MLQTVILAGGKGARLNGQRGASPKALVNVAGQPLIEHVMDIYRRRGHDHFVVATGHRHEAIHHYFERERQHCGDRVDCVFTGEGTQSGGRLKRLQPHIRGDAFFMTWTDGVADIDVDELLKFHRGHGRIATLTAVYPPPRFGHLSLDGNGRVTSFEEKPHGREGLINGAFFVLQREVFDFIEGDESEFERHVLAPLAEAGQLMAYRYPGQWRCIDTPADIDYFENAGIQSGPLKDKHA